MKKFYYFYLFSLLYCIPLSAQTTKEDALKNIDCCSGLFYAYPTPSSISETPAPAGFTPFYISHYGRHGSRWIDDAEEYTQLLKIFSQAANDKNLTAFGSDIKKRIEMIWADANGRLGQLTTKGGNQHRGIAERMFYKYTAVFKGKNKKIESRSSVAERCILSMAAFDERLKELNPSLSITRECGKRFQDYLAYHTPEAKDAYGNRYKTWYATFDKFRNSHCDPSRVMKSLFNESDYCLKHHIDAMDFYYALYRVYNDVQNIDLKISLSDLFNKDELWNLWQTENLGEYFGMGSHPIYGKYYAKSQLKLLNNFIESADNAIKNGYPAATLRFGHDSYITPFTILLGLKNCEVYTEDYDHLYSLWTDFKISQMAANIQWIFYRNNRNEVLIKILLNEHEMEFNELKSDSFPYYKWNDVRAYLLKKF